MEASEPRRSGRTGCAARPNSRLWSYKGSERREGSGARAAGVEEISGRENGKGSGSVANRAECLTQNKTTGENEMVKMHIDGALVDGPRTMQVIDPSAETIAADVPDAPTAHVPTAVAATAEAFPARREHSPAARRPAL